MLDFFITAYQENPATTLEVFVHKAESLAEDYKIGMSSRDNTPMFFRTYPRMRHDRAHTSDGPCPPACLRAS
jgi:hypothetical protein